MVTIKRSSTVLSQLVKVNRPVELSQYIQFHSNYFSDENRSVTFALKSVVCHAGRTIHSGHYNTLVLSNIDNDTILTECDDKLITHQLLTGKFSTFTESCAYLLVYEQINESPLLSIALHSILFLTSSKTFRSVKVYNIFDTDRKDTRRLEILTQIQKSVTLYDFHVLTKKVCVMPCLVLAWALAMG